MPKSTRRVQLVRIGDSAKKDGRKKVARQLKRKQGCDDEEVPIPSLDLTDDSDDDIDKVESGHRGTRGSRADGDSAHGKTKDVSQTKRRRVDEEPTPGHSKDLTDDNEKDEHERRATRGLLAKGGPADGTAGRVKVIVSKRQQAANEQKKRMLKLWAMQAEAPTTRGKEDIMAETWKSREPKRLEEDQLPTKNDVLRHEYYLVCEGKINPRGSYESRAKVLAKDVIGVWTKCKVTPQPFNKVKQKCRYLLESKKKHSYNRQEGAPMVPPMQTSC